MNPTPPPTTSASIAVSPTGSANGTFGPITGGFTGSATIPAASTNATLTTTFSASAPSGTPQLQSVQRRPANIGASAITPLAFVTITSNATVSFATAPSFTFTPPSGVTATLASLSYVAEYDPTNPSAGWTTILGPATLQGSSLFFDSGSSTAITLAAGKTYSFVLFTVPQALPVPSPTPTPLTCASTARQGAAHLAATYPGASWVVPNQLAVTYRASAASRAPQSIDRTVNSVHTLDLGIMSGNGHRVLTLAPGTDMTAATATLRKSSDVLAVDPVHYRRPSSYPNVTTLNSDDGVNDPFSDNVDQWYLYKTGTNPTAWQTSKSASNISIAIIDTGVDETNKDFVFDVRESVVNGVKTTGNGAAQDTDGHGTNVAGL
ncbi:MAG TPA: S8 family serine peptidase, partial [Candidatus Acidoferrum sp.]|nr:S8 family serine peptidase [Candidatus Acidoferrum sp.]